MSKSSAAPELTKYIDKPLEIKLVGNRQIKGTLRGFDQFMNLVIAGTSEISGSDENEIGTVVVRGNSVVMMECMEHVGRTVYNPKTR